MTKTAQSAHFNFSGNQDVFSGLLNPAHTQASLRGSGITQDSLKTSLFTSSHFVHPVLNRKIIATIKLDLQHNNIQLFLSALTSQSTGDALLTAELDTTPSKNILTGKVEQQLLTPFIKKTLSRTGQQAMTSKHKNLPSAVTVPNITTLKDSNLGRGAVEQ